MDGRCRTLRSGARGGLINPGSAPHPLILDKPQRSASELTLCNLLRIVIYAVRRTHNSAPNSNPNPAAILLPFAAIRLPFAAIPAAIRGPSAANELPGCCQKAAICCHLLPSPNSAIR